MKQLKLRQRISLFLTLGILLSLLRAPLLPAEEAGWALPAETEAEWVIPEETEGEILPEEMAVEDYSAAEGADPVLLDNITLSESRIRISRRTRSLTRKMRRRSPRKATALPLPQTSMRRTASS